MWTSREDIAALHRRSGRSFVSPTTCLFLFRFLRSLLVFHRHLVLITISPFHYSDVFSLLLSDFWALLLVTPALGPTLLPMSAMSQHAHALVMKKNVILCQGWGKRGGQGELGRVTVFCTLKQRYLYIL